MKTDNKHMGSNRNHKKEIRKRIGVMLLSLVVAVTMMPVFAFADETPVPDDQAPAEAAEMQEEPAVQEDEQTEKVITDIEIVADADNVNGSSESGFGQTEMIVPEPEAVRITGGADDEKQLLGEFVEKETSDQVALNSGEQVRIKSVRGDRLRGNTKKYYEALVAGISRIAEGSQTEAVVTVDLRDLMGGRLSFSAADLGVNSLWVEGKFSPLAQQAFEEKFRCDIKPLYNALLYDLPYKFYWHDKTVNSGAMLFNVVSAKTGEPVGYYANSSSVYFKEADDPVVRFSFCVSADYSPDGQKGTQKLKAERIADANAAAKNAAALITENKDITSDYQKLINYKDYICDNNVYNSAAASTVGTADYGDPWQMISVFDGKPETNVVCEGYSKALQFLCDHTDFTSSIVECYSVSGRLDTNVSYSGTVSGKMANHMWNIIRMNDGRYYMADITNCDGSTSFAPDKLFLRGSATASTPSEGYRFNGNNGKYLYYRYDTDTVSMFSYELELSDSDYSTETTADEGQISAGIKKAIDQRSVADDAHETELYYARRAAAAAAESAIVEAARKAAEEAARRHVHAYHATNYLDYVTYRCTGCGSSYSVSKVIVDLPKVSIKKPGRAKASFTAKWKKLSKKNRNKVGGIEIQYSTRRDFASSYTVTTAKKTAASKKFKKLARKTTYYVRVRSYSWISGKKHVSAWSAVKSVKTK